MNMYYQLVKNAGKAAYEKCVDENCLPEVNKTKTTEKIPQSARLRNFKWPFTQNGNKSRLYSGTDKLKEKIFIFCH